LIWVETVPGIFGSDGVFSVKMTCHPGAAIVLYSNGTSYEYVSFVGDQVGSDIICNPNNGTFKLASEIEMGLYQFNSRSN
jgi:hypothetical protein